MRCRARLITVEGFTKTVEVPYPPRPLYYVAIIPPLRASMIAERVERIETVYSRMEFYLYSTKVVGRSFKKDRKGYLLCTYREVR